LLVRVSFLVASSCLLIAASRDSVVVVVNANSAPSAELARYYIARRGIPPSQVCTIRTTDAEVIDRQTYQQQIFQPLADCLKQRKLLRTTLYLVTTMGVPLRIAGHGSGLNFDGASVDSELCLLPRSLQGWSYPLSGPVANPYFAKNAPFSRAYGIYLVTRLAAYDLAGAKQLVDRALAARNRGKFVLDLRSAESDDGNRWLRNAALLLPASRVLLDETEAVITQARDVIGYGSWGSNDHNRKQRKLGFHWLPGAIVTEYVSTNARTFLRPPRDWNIGSWSKKETWFGGSPQTLTADYLEEGATGASGHVDEPYLHYSPRPDILFPAYYSGRNLAESFWSAIPALSWQNVVIGDPLCTLGEPSR
jgi:uncharacterized protein (TIGR03790 family)